MSRLSSPFRRVKGCDGELQGVLGGLLTVIGGQVVSALLCVGTGPLSHSIWAAAIAGGLAIGATMLLRMPHSPAAATAVIGTLATTGQMSFVVCVGVAACILVGFGILGSQLRGAKYPTYWI